MKNLFGLFVILLFVVPCKAQNNKYPQLIDEQEDYYANYSYADYKREFHQEYAFFYKRTVTKDSKSYSETIKNEQLLWVILKSSNPKEFFSQITNSIKIEDRGKERLNITASYDLTDEQINEYQRTGGIENKDKLSDLLTFEILSTDITNTTTKEKVTFDENWVKSCCDIFPTKNPTKERLFFYNHKHIDLKQCSGSISVRLRLPAAYSVTEITQNDIGKTIEIAGNQKIKLIEFIDNKVHFEVLNNEKLKSEIKFTNVSPTIKRINIPKHLYDIFRTSPKMKYSKFEKEYQKYLDTEDDNLEENTVYVYTLEGKPDKFYVYSPVEKTLLEKELTLNLN